MRVSLYDNFLEILHQLSRYFALKIHEREAQCSNFQIQRRGANKGRRERARNIIKSFKERVTALLKRSCYCESFPFPSHLFNEAGSYTARRLALRAFPLSAQIYDDAAHIPSGRYSFASEIPPFLSASPRSLVPLVAPAFGAGVPSEAHELFSRLCPWENTRVAPVGIVNATANCARRRRRRLLSDQLASLNIVFFHDHLSPFYFGCFCLRFGASFVEKVAFLDR